MGGIMRFVFQLLDAGGVVPMVMRYQNISELQIVLADFIKDGSGVARIHGNGFVLYISE